LTFAMSSMNRITKTLEAGGRLLTGGKPIKGPGAFYESTVVTDVKHGMSLYHEETFGPVSAIIPVQDADEAISVANDSDFGLGGSIWTSDVNYGEALARRVESGALYAELFKATNSHWRSFSDCLSKWYIPKWAGTGRLAPLLMHVKITRPSWSNWAGLLCFTCR